MDSGHIVFFSIGIGHKLSLEIRLLHNHLDNLKAFYIAKAGIQRVIAERVIPFRENRVVYNDGFNQPWLNNEALFKGAAFGEGAYTVENQDAVGIYGMSDEQAKININKADFVLLKTLFMQHLQSDAESANIAAAVIDWRDKDTSVYQDPATNILIGAEGAYYQAQDKPYCAKDADFDAIEEILLVKDVTPEIFHSIKNYITVYGNGTININTAPRVVLVSVLGDKIADYIINFRQPDANLFGERWFIAVNPNEPIALDTNKIRNIRDDNPDPALGDTETERNDLWNQLRTKELGGIIGVGSSVFKINSAGQVKGMNSNIEAVVEFTGTSGACKFISWHQY